MKMRHTLAMAFTVLGLFTAEGYGQAARTNGMVRTLSVPNLPGHIRYPDAQRNYENGMKQLERQRAYYLNLSVRSGMERTKYGTPMPKMTNEVDIQRYITNYPKYRVVNMPHGRD